jgi:hypothetical protein
MVKGICCVSACRKAGGIQKNREEEVVHHRFTDRATTQVSSCKRMSSCLQAYRQAGIVMLCLQDNWQAQVATGMGDRTSNPAWIAGFVTHPCGT